MDARYYQMHWCARSSTFQHFKASHRHTDRQTDRQNDRQTNRHNTLQMGSPLVGCYTVKVFKAQASHRQKLRTTQKRKES